MSSSQLYPELSIPAILNPLSSSTYIYEPLLPGHIRLMTLLSGDGEDPIRCELNSVSIDNVSETGLTTSYDALSYMWDTGFLGSTELSLPGFVHIRDTVLFTRGNLLRALDRLRCRWRCRVLWIDAICIDQASIPERNHQVSRMRHIYQQASSVLVWVCDEQDIKSVKRYPFRSSLEQISKLSTDSNNGELIELSFDVVRFCCAPYWSHLWIIQETLSARKLVVHCGRITKDWQHVADNLAVAASRQKYESSVPSVTNTPIWTMVKSFQNKDTTLTLRQLLLRHGDSQCHDRRDLVYGILGLASDCQNGEIPIDYAISMQDLFDRVVALYSHCNDSAMKRFVFHLRNILL